MKVRRAYTEVDDYYIVLAEPSGDGYLAWCPDVPGYTAAADSPTAALETWQDDLGTHLANLARTNRPAPERRIHAIGMVKP